MGRGETAEARRSNKKSGKSTSEREAKKNPDEIFSRGARTVLYFYLSPILCLRLFDPSS